MLAILGKLFGSTERVKIIRLFLLNIHANFTAADISGRSKISPAVVRKELKNLSDAGMIKRNRAGEWEYDPTFPLSDTLRNLLVSAESIRADDVLKRFRNVGKIKLLVVAGIFIQSTLSRADILIVGDAINRQAVERGVRSLEAEIGRELTYSVLETEEYRYRESVYDKFIHDVLDFPHIKLIDRMSS